MSAVDVQNLSRIQKMPQALLFHHFKSARLLDTYEPRFQVGTGKQSFVTDAARRFQNVKGFYGFVWISNGSGFLKKWVYFEPPLD